jgi:GntR family transcriptional regulator / MocR family aminotransferase
MVKRVGGASLQSIAIDRNSAKTISAQVCTALRDLILAGSLRAGQRLPATRTLAKDLGTARATVIEAFEQLVSEGLLESRTGAGTFVSQALDTERPIGPVSDTRATTVKRVTVSRLMAAASDRFVHRLPHLPRAFTTAMPDFDAFPMAQWARIASKHWRSARQFALGYGDAQGYRPLRQAIAGHLRADRGIACDWQQVFIVSGAQQGFQLIASTLLDPGDRVWFENPGAIGARNSFILHGAELVPVPVDDDGLDVARARRYPGPRLFGLSSVRHVSYGARSGERRRRLPPAYARTCGVAHRRRLDLSRGHVRQHECPGDHGGRKGCCADP